MVLGTRLRPTVLREILRWISRNQGLRLNYSNIARAVSSSVPTLKRAIDAMESLFLVRRLGDSSFIEDQGLATHLMGGVVDSHKFQATRFFFQEIRTQVAYHPGQPLFLESYKTRGGTEIPFIIRSHQSPLIAITVDGEDYVSEKSLRGLALFRKQFQKSTVVALHMGKRFYHSSNEIICAPVAGVV